MSVQYDVIATGTHNNIVYSPTHRKENRRVLTVGEPFEKCPSWLKPKKKVDTETTSAKSKISQAAIDLAEANDIDLTVIVGTGSNGNITKGDVQAVIDQKAKEQQSSDPVTFK